jgi:hypothetical protein
VLRGVLVAVDRDQASQLTSPAEASQSVNKDNRGRLSGPPTCGGTGDCVERRRRFEARDTGVTILTPQRPDSRWRAIIPLGVLPDDGTTLGAASLCALMDKLDLFYPSGR